MTKKRATAAVLRTTSSIAMWMIRAATFCTGLLAMLALVVVLATLMPAATGPGGNTSEFSAPRTVAVA